MFFTGLAPLVWSAPPEIVRINREEWLPVLRALQVLLHQLGSDTNDMLALPVLDHVQRLECADDVLLSETSHCTALCDNKTTIITINTK